MSVSGSYLSFDEEVRAFAVGVRVLDCCARSCSSARVKRGDEEFIKNDHDAREERIYRVEVSSSLHTLCTGP